MKKLPLSILSALALASATQAQTTVNSDPVGFVSVTLKANSDSPMSTPLHRASALQSTVSSVSSNSVTVAAQLTSHQFKYSSPTQTNRYYLLVGSTVNTNSIVKGQWFEITDNDTSSITVASSGAQTVQALGLASGDSVQIIPFWTLNTLFPNGQGLTATSNIDAPADSVSFLPQSSAGEITVSGVNLSASQVNIYNTDSQVATGWLNAGTYEPSGDDPIVPDSYFIIRNSGVAKVITMTGGVPTTNLASPIVRLVNGKAQDNFAANPYPVPISLAQSQLFESGAFTATTNIDAPTDLLYVYDGTESGVNVQASAVYFYSTDASLGASGWYNAGTYAGPLDTNQVLLPGRAFVIRKSPGAAGSTLWTVTKPY